MNSIRKLLATLSQIALIVSASGLFLMTVVIGWQVFGRKVLNDSPAWSESVALLLMLYFVLLASAAGVREGFHLRFRLLNQYLPAAAANALLRAVQLIVAIFGILMAINGWKLAEFTASHLIPTLGVSRSLAYWPFIIAGSLITLFALERMVAEEPEGATD